MWVDNETDIDFLNFRCVADSAAEVIVQAEGRPLSIGVSGGWGIGKSSMLRLISASLQERDKNQYLFVEFNAWLYQGFDDARAALLETIATTLVDRAGTTTAVMEKAKGLLARVNWLRVAGITAGSAVGLAAGLPPVGLLGMAWSAAKGLVDGNISGDDATAAQRVISRGPEAASGLLNAVEPSPQRMIHDLRKDFAETLNDLNVTLVVFIDDLDRCLPATTIATLEAVRLFLFLPRTAFVIAADDRMIRHAVRTHFKLDALDNETELVTNYFDKLIQVPLRVPPLGTQEVRAYLMLLFLEKSSLSVTTKENVRTAVCARLAQGWQGRRVDLHFMLETIGECPDDLKRDLELADRLAPLMTTSRQIAGNPRLIKRFLNTLRVRMAIARSQHVSVDEAVLAKMILFERCGSPDAYASLISVINNDQDGQPRFISDWEQQVQLNKPLVAEKPWDDPFVQSWLALPPMLGSLDLRGVVYVSREHMPIITASDQLSSEGAALLDALFELRTNVAPPALTDKLKALSRRDTGLMMQRVLTRARHEHRWGTPPALWAGLTLAVVDQGLQGDFATFLGEIACERLEADIVPVIADKAWARPTLAKWSAAAATSLPVKAAIKNLRVEKT